MGGHRTRLFYHLASKRRRDGRWNLSSNNWYPHLGPAGKPSKMVTFFALRMQKRVRAL